MRQRNPGGPGTRVAILSAMAPRYVESMAVGLWNLACDPVGWLAPEGARAETDQLAVFSVPDEPSLVPVLRALEPDLVLCCGFSWKLSATTLRIPRLGSINVHPAQLPRHRGPLPLAWALRDGDREFGVTLHYMTESFDSGPILQQTTIPIDDDDCTIEQIEPKVVAAALELLPGALERAIAGDPGDPQDEERATWAGFLDGGYATIDWSGRARDIHNQVRAWRLTCGIQPIVAATGLLDGAPARILSTSLTDPGTDARVVECGDGPLWITEYERPDDPERVPLAVPSARGGREPATR